MKADIRRNKMLSVLSEQSHPISGTALAEMFDVSRQVIVGDMAILKSEGHDIQSTHFGYLLKRSPLAERVFKIYHTKENTEDELNTIVDLGGIVANVYVWHKVYGRLEAELNIANRRDVAVFIEGISSGKSTELMNITGGYHYHTVRAEKEAVLDDINDALTRKGYIVPEK